VIVDLRRFVVLLAALLLLAGCSSGASHPSASSSTAASTPASTRPSTTFSAPTIATPTRPKRTTSPAPRPRTTSSTTSRPAPPPPASTTAAAVSLPLPYSTGAATRVITVVAPSTGSTTATLQAWQKSARGWTRYGSAVFAYVGSDGLSTHPSESISATPMGSFNLTQVFGRQPNPGTGLPYRQTTPADWWISQPGPLYNTLQHCSSGCAFTQGDPNEHLYYTTPYYRYAVVIDYNRYPVVQGAGSAFFLHVANGAPTAGCVAIPEATLVTLLRWLTPAANPRILIGVG
jgi:L,D-peptidoglycan transpeptidase YkuD (ErfK/YbiS/YcfS/YnhG family)